MKQMFENTTKQQAEKMLAEVVCRLSQSSGDLNDMFQLLVDIKGLKQPLKNVDYYRAVVFSKLGRPYEEVEALKEELRYFPDNNLARDRLASCTSAVPSKSRVEEREFAEIYHDICAHTMLSEDRLYSLFSHIKQLAENNIQGDIVECGVAGGGSSALIALTLKKHSIIPRMLYACDSYSGMPAPGEEDTHNGINASDTGWGEGTCAASEVYVEKLLEDFGVADDVELLKGVFEVTLPTLCKRIRRIALLHIDGDWYKSTKDVLENLFDLVVDGGVVQVDDFGHWSGCKAALLEFSAERGINLDLETIDYSGVWFRVSR